MKVDILHMSDLHVCKANVDSIDAIRGALFRDLRRLKERYGVAPDLVFVTGDLVHKGEDAYDLVLERVMSPLLTELGLDESRLFVVPGNHDVDRSKSTEAIEQGLESLLTSTDRVGEYLSRIDNDRAEFELVYRKLESFRAFRDRIRNNALRSTLHFDTHRVDLGDLSVGIVGLNSAWRSSQYGEDEGRLIVGVSVLDAACAPIRDCDIRVALMHHPFEMLAPWDARQLRMSMSRDIDVLFTGHMHDSDSQYSQLISGGLFVSTSASFCCGRISNGYSLVRLDPGDEKIHVFLRRYYDSPRKEFDQETEKCEDGIVSFGPFRLRDPERKQLVEIAEIREELVSDIEGEESPLLAPLLELMYRARLEEVFVEPIITDTSYYEKREDKRELYRLGRLMDSGRNLAFFGGKEFGKTTLLNYIRLQILHAGGVNANQIPVMVSFSDIPKNNPGSLKRVIMRNLNGRCTPEQVERFLAGGHVTLLVDDFDDHRDHARAKRKQSFLDFCREYPKCRYVLTASDTMSRTFVRRSLELEGTIEIDHYYLGPLNTGRIRELLSRWSRYRTFDVDEMVGRIVYFFSQLRVPVTPMAVVLFLGVLFRDESQSHPTNEAYLVENYLETILEKLNPEDTKHDLDFRDKESFLAHVAFAMVQRGRRRFTTTEFERLKLDYFSHLGEDPPDPGALAVLFRRGVLQESDGMVCFKFGAWFHFFLAKAMQKQPEVKRMLLMRKDYLRYSRAFAYKAGLDRNDRELLKTISDRAAEKMTNALPGLTVDLKQLEIEDALLQMGDAVEKTVREKSDAASRDRVRDQKYLTYETDDQQTVEEQDAVAEEELGEAIELVTLTSDIIRSTRELGHDDKRVYLTRNIHHYVLLVIWLLDSFRAFVKSLSVDEAKDLLLGHGSRPQADADLDVEAMVDKVRRMVCTVIPLSVISYMADHLANPRLRNVVVSLVESSEDEVFGLFCTLLLLRLNFATGMAHVSRLAKQRYSYTLDALIYLYLFLYCREHKTNDDQLNQVVEAMKTIRCKYERKLRKLPPYQRSTFESDMRNRLRLEQRRLDGLGS